MEADLHLHINTPPTKRPKVQDSGDNSKLQPKVLLSEISDKEVKRRTGFKDLLTLLLFISVVCDGDLDAMTTTLSTLTWFEEWLLYFEMVWNRSITRWVDGEKEYGVNERIVRDVFSAKLKMVVVALHKWPRFVNHEEDMQLRSRKWKDRYPNQRIMMWDNTNVDFMGKPSDADMQRLTYSLYYGGNVAKGAIFLQLSGWLGGWNLWLGGVSDTDYLDRSGLLKFQEEFQENDPSAVLPFTNILDKGYRSTLAAWRAGGQLLLQPSFAKSDRKFTTGEVLHSATVASDRSRNERAVKRMKTSGKIAGGIHQTQNLEMFDDLWLAWGFQCNFMYKPVL